VSYCNPLRQQTPKPINTAPHTLSTPPTKPNHTLKVICDRRNSPESCVVHYDQVKDIIAQTQQA